VVRRISLLICCLAIQSFFCASLFGQSARQSGAEPQRLTAEGRDFNIIEACANLNAKLRLLALLDDPKNSQYPAFLSAIRDSPVGELCSSVLLKARKEAQNQRFVAKCDEIVAGVGMIYLLDDSQFHGRDAVAALTNTATIKACEKHGWTWDGFHARNPSINLSVSPVEGPPRPQANGQPWSWFGKGLSHTDYIGYTAANGQYVKPGPPYETHITLGASWNDKLRMYEIHIGCGAIYSRTLSFGFDDKCDQSAKTPVPNCIYKCRNDYTVSGQISIDVDKATYSGEFFDNAAPGGAKKGRVTCTFVK
jgi:hypothetical protein